MPRWRCGARVRQLRGKIDRELLSYTVPFRMFVGMEGNVEPSFLGTYAWRKLRERWQG